MIKRSSYVLSNIHGYFTNDFRLDLAYVVNIEHRRLRKSTEMTKVDLSSCEQTTTLTKLKLNRSKGP